MIHPLIDPVLELVQAAGQATLPYWQANVAVQTKADAGDSSRYRRA